MNIEQIVGSWKDDKPKYEELGTQVFSFIKSTITECEILPEVSYRPKELLSIVKKIKKRQRETPNYSYSSLNDKLGVRVVCSFQEEMEVIDKYLYKYFEIKKVEKKKEELNFKTLDYISNHYDACIKLNIQEFSTCVHLKDLVFEIQVRTLNQHAWANTAHALSYKQEIDIPSSLNRKIYRLLSLYEIADDEFSIVNRALIEHPDNTIYKLLKNLESKIYKYAQVDYDRETSIYTLRIITQYLDADQVKTAFEKIEDFILTNEIKIQRIFKESKERYFEIPFLTQPEIFLVWYCLENFSFAIKDNWVNDFDPSELEQISNLWGTQIE